VALALLVAVVAYLDLVTGPLVDAAVFYHLPIILACALLDFYWLLIIPVFLRLHLAIEYLELSQGVPLNLLNDWAKVGSFTTVAALTLFARHLYLTLVEKSRELVAKQRLAESEMALAEQVQHCLFNIPAEGYHDHQLTIHAYNAAHSRVGGDF